MRTLTLGTHQWGPLLQCWCWFVGFDSHTLVSERVFGNRSFQLGISPSFWPRLTIQIAIGAKHSIHPLPWHLQWFFGFFWYIHHVIQIIHQFLLRMSCNAKDLPGVRRFQHILAPTWIQYLPATPVLVIGFTISKPNTVTKFLHLNEKHANFWHPDKNEHPEMILIVQNLEFNLQPRLVELQRPWAISEVLRKLLWIWDSKLWTDKLWSSYLKRIRFHSRAVSGNVCSRYCMEQRINAVLQDAGWLW